MTNEELRNIENAAAKKDIISVDNIITNASAKKEFDAYNLKAAVNQLMLNAAYLSLDKLIAEGIISTDLYDYERFDTSVLNTLIKPSFLMEDSMQEYVGWLGTFLAKIDDIDEEIASQSLLAHAIENNAPIAILKAIAGAGADIGYSDQYGQTLLFKVCSQRAVMPEQTTEVVDWLLMEGADPNAANVEAKTPLHASVQSVKLEVTKQLLEAGADPNLADWHGETPFYYAAVHQQNPALVALLLGYQIPDFHQVNKQGENLLNGYLRSMYGESEGSLRIVDLLLSHGGDLTESSQWYQKGRTGVDWVVEKSAAFLEQLIDAGRLDPAYTDDQGNTLLHKVCMVDLNYDESKARELYQKVKMLLSRRVDPAIENAADKKAVDYAMADNLKVKTVGLLLKD